MAVSAWRRTASKKARAMPPRSRGSALSFGPAAHQRSTKARAFPRGATGLTYQSGVAAVSKRDLRMCSA